MDATGKAMVDHWTWAATKGLLNRNTAGGLRAASSQVLGALDNWESLDVTQLNVDDALIRFTNLRSKKFKPRSLETYKHRFRIAHESFLSYLKDPGGWKHVVPSRPTRAPRNGDGESRAAAPRVSDVEISVQPLPATGLVEYPFPLHEGQTARLILPRDLKAADVRRLTAFLATLALDYEGSAN
jgi:hypothetical protein